MKLQEFRKFSAPELVQPTRARLAVPAFTLPVPTWAGASLIIAEYPIENDYYFSLKLPIDAFGENFVAAVRYVEDGVVFRFLLFEHDDMVLYYPVYNGEVLGADAVIEIWSVNSEEAPVLVAAKILESSVLAIPTGCGVCCEIPRSDSTLVVREPTIIDPYSYCNPFCLPIEVT